MVSMLTQVEDEWVPWLIVDTGASIAAVPIEVDHAAH